MLEQQTLMDLIGSTTFSSFPSNLKLADFVKQSDISGNSVVIVIQLPFPCEGLILALTDELTSLLTNKWPDNQFEIQTTESHIFSMLPRKALGEDKCERDQRGIRENVTDLIVQVLE